MKALRFLILLSFVCLAFGSGFSGCADNDDEADADESVFGCEDFCAKVLECEGLECVAEDCAQWCFDYVPPAMLECATIDSCEYFENCVCADGGNDDDANDDADDDINDDVDDDTDDDVDDDVDDDIDDDADDDGPFSVEITAPGQSEAFGPSESVALRGLVTGYEGDPATWSLQWSSDVDGVLDTTPPNVVGFISATAPSLTPGAHLITLSVTDTEQNTEFDNVSINVFDYEFSIEPVCAILEAGESLALSAPDAVAPVVYSFEENASGGTLDSVTGEYTAGSTAWKIDRVKCEDANGQSDELDISVVGQWVGSQLSMISGDANSGSRSYRVSSADYDFDSDFDFMVANIGTGHDRIFVNNGTGGLTAVEPFPLYASREVKFIDYDSDKLFDVAFGGSDSSGSHLYQNLGGNVFLEIYAWGSSQEDCLGMAVGDLNGDGYPEIICAHNQETHPVDMTILKNIDDGAGGRTFTQLYFGPPDMTTQALSLSDVDSDGDLDLAVGGSYLTSGDTSIQNLLCINDGQAGMTCRSEFGSGATAEVVFADFDGDSDEDLLVSNRSEPLAVWWNSGGSNPTFTEDQDVFDSEVNMGAVRQFGVADIDGDSDTDVLVAQGGASATATVYLNKGNGSFCGHLAFDSPQTLSTASIQASHLIELNNGEWMDFVITRYRDYNEAWITQ